MRAGSNRPANQDREPADTVESPGTIATCSLGLKVRAGRAVVVILRGASQAPEMVLRHEIDLADPWVRESMHPYHQELGDRGPEGLRARRRGCAAAGNAARRAVRSLVHDMRSHGFDPRGAAIVVASLADPARVPGAHARAHAEETKLYREAVESTLGACRLRVATFLEKNVHSVAVAQLRLSGQQVDAMLKVFARQVGILGARRRSKPPWPRGSRCRSPPNVSGTEPRCLDGKVEPGDETDGRLGRSQLIARSLDGREERKSAMTIDDQTGCPVHADFDPLSPMSPPGKVQATLHEGHRAGGSSAHR